MSKVQRGLILAVVAFMIGAFPVLAADFYETQLRLGAEAYRTGRLTDAVDYIRIANFGFLDRPPLLVEGLARLTLAQNAAGLRDEMSKTIDRFITVEREFPNWASVRFDDELRAKFENILLENLSREAVQGIPSLASIVPSEEDRILAMAPAERRRYWEGKAKIEPTNSRWPLLIAKAEAEDGDTRGALRWSERALDIDPDLVEARVLRVAVYTQRGDHKKAAISLQGIPDQAWYDYPQLVADAFVIYTRTNMFDNADQLYDRVPPELFERDDVAEAMAAFRRREASRLEQQAATDPIEDEVTPGESTPPAAPIEGAEEPVEARMKTPRGSFTTPSDPVAEALTISKRLIGEGRPGDAQLVLRDAIRKDPGSRELRLAMLEASCLGGDWRTGISQLLLIEPFRSGEEKYMFYGAVVYFESEKMEDSRELMAIALPKLARNPYVDHYARLVMGEP